MKIGTKMLPHQEFDVIWVHCVLFWSVAHVILIGVLDMNTSYHTPMTGYFTTLYRIQIGFFLWKISSKENWDKNVTTRLKETNICIHVNKVA